MTFSEQFLHEVEAVARQLDRQAIEQTAELLARVRARGRPALHSRGGAVAQETRRMP